MSVLSKPLTIPRAGDLGQKSHFATATYDNAREWLDFLPTSGLEQLHEAVRLFNMQNCSTYVEPLASLPADAGAAKSMTGFQTIAMQATSSLSAAGAATLLRDAINAAAPPQPAAVAAKGNISVRSSSPASAGSHSSCTNLASKTTSSACSTPARQASCSSLPAAAGVGLIPATPYPLMRSKTEPSTEMIAQLLVKLAEHRTLLDDLGAAWSYRGCQPCPDQTAFPLPWPPATAIPAASNCPSSCLRSGQEVRQHVQVFLKADAGRSPTKEYMSFHHQRLKHEPCPCWVLPDEYATAMGTPGQAPKLELFLDAAACAFRVHIVLLKVSSLEHVFSQHYPLAFSSKCQLLAHEVPLRTMVLSVTGTSELPHVEATCPNNPATDPAETPMIDPAHPLSLYSAARAQAPPGCFVRMPSSKPQAQHEKEPAEGEVAALELSWVGSLFKKVTKKGVITSTRQTANTATDPAAGADQADVQHKQVARHQTAAATLQKGSRQAQAAPGCKDNGHIVKVMPAAKPSPMTSQSDGCAAVPSAQTSLAQRSHEAGVVRTGRVKQWVQRLLVCMKKPHSAMAGCNRAQAPDAVQAGLVPISPQASLQPQCSKSFVIRALWRPVLPAAPVSAA